MNLDLILDWLDRNEGVLSAIAAMVVILGLLLTPLRLLVKRGRRSGAASPEAEAGDSVPLSGVGRTVYIATFQSIGDDDSLSVMALGIGTELGHALSRTSGTRVVLTEDRARYGVSGSLMQVGEEIRVLARLADNSGEQIWSHAYDAPREGFLSLQREICADIATEIGGEFMSREFENMSFSRTSSTDAWAHTVHSAHMVIQRGGGANTWNDAIDEANKAIDLDPSYAQAHARLAALHGERIGNFVSPDIRADRDAAIACAERAIELGAHDPFVLMNSGQGLSNAGEAERGRELLERAHRAIPHDALCSVFLWNNFLSTGTEAELRDAIVQGERELQRYPNHPLAAIVHGTVGAMHLHIGEIEASRALLRRSYNAAPGIAYFGACYAVALHALGSGSDAEVVIDDYVARGFRLNAEFVATWAAAVPRSGNVTALFASMFERGEQDKPGPEAA